MIKEFVLVALLSCCAGLPTYAVADNNSSFDERISSKSSYLSSAQTQAVYELEIAEGYGTLRAPDGTVLIDGMLQPDGTAGMSYVLVAPEGNVCGNFYLSKWDPNNEGQSLGNQLSVEWLPPDGSVVRTCGSIYADASGLYASDSDSFQGTFLKIVQPVTDNYVLELEAGQGTLIAPDGSILIDGMLQPDGTAGMSYILVAPEGNVCGNFYLSRWDPNNEGQSLENQLSVEWLPPDGSVVRTCGSTYADASGLYSINSDSFQGTFTKD